MLQFKNDRFSMIEQTAIETLCLGQPAAIAKGLIRQFTLASVKVQKFTEKGFFTYIDVPEDCEPVDDTVHIIEGVQMKVSELQYPCSFTLFVKHGYLHALECATEGEKWPENVAHFEIVNAQKD